MALGCQRQRHVSVAASDVPKPFTTVRDDDDDANDENNPFAKAWNWLNRRARE